MKLEVDLFSGRPNPVFYTSPEQAETIRRTMQQLADAPGGESKVFGGLGYRGFRVTDMVRNCEFRLWHDLVVGEESGVAFSKADPERRLERICLSIAQEHIDPDLHSFLQQQAGECDES